MGRPPEHPPGYYNQKTNKFYEVKTVCVNCGNYQIIQVNKGTRVGEVINDIDCENCGCRTLEKM